MQSGKLNGVTMRKPRLNKYIILNRQTRSNTMRNLLLYNIQSWTGQEYADKTCPKSWQIKLDYYLIKMKTNIKIEIKEALQRNWRKQTKRRKW